MCNHYRNDPVAMAKLPTWREFIGYDAGDAGEQSTDVWPKREGIVARIDGDRRIMDRMAWGVPLTVPGKRPGSTITKHVTNVRNLTSPFWRSMLAKPAQRCLVPFTSFAEPKMGAGREEHWFTVNGSPVAAFAGIWRPSDADNVYAFLTCEPNPLVAPLHPKAMPVILQPDDYETWLTTDYEGACALAHPFPSQLMAVV
jgi:putative SOS response-associated peptidase YedK